MNKFAHAHSVLISNKQFRARIARKEYGHFNEVGQKENYNLACYLLFASISV